MMMHVKEFAPDLPCVGRVRGLKAGPALAVLGYRSDLERAIARLKAIPSVSYLRGEIAFFDLSEKALSEQDILQSFDDVFIAAPLDRSADDMVAFDRLYWAILGRSAELGQISGRGVPEQKTI